MNSLNILIIIIVSVMFIGFVYINFRLPQNLKKKKEKRQEELNKR
ncbi:hypothetical protein [Clostridium psychrophilum]|nr:hypothetical protein [Clostridium psychrophilum]